MKWLRVSAALLLTLLSGLPASTFADDTEIYTRQVRSITEDVRPNILFMLDNSGSMLWPMRDPENGTDTGQDRIDILKDALLAMLDEVHNVNVGIGRFTALHGNVNTPILYPVAYIDGQIQETGDEIIGATYASIPISQGNDDAEEASTDAKTMVLSDDTLEITTQDAATVMSSQIFSSRDDVREFASNGSSKGVVWAKRDDPAGATFDSLVVGTTNDDKYITGLRFQSIAIPKGATIQSAKILFTALANASANNTFFDLDIEGINQGHTDAFSVEKNGVTSLPATTASVTWNVDSKWYDDLTYATPDLTQIVSEIVDHADWQVGNSMSFRFENPSNDVGFRRFYSFDEEPAKAPILRLVYEVPEGLTYEMQYIQQISAPENDGVEFIGSPDGTMTLYDEFTTGPGTTWSDYIRLGTGNCKTRTTCRGESLAGFRFTDIPIPKGTELSEARIEMTYTESGDTHRTEPLDLEIYAENNTSAEPFDLGYYLPYNFQARKYKSSDLTQRLPSGATPVMWRDVPAWSEGKEISTPDLKGLIQPLIDSNSWGQADNAIVLLMQRDQSQPWTDLQGQRRISNYGVEGDPNSEPEKAARLILKWTTSAEASLPTPQKIGLRFQGVEIPQGAKVHDAKLIFTSGIATDSTGGTVTIQGEKGLSEPFSVEPGNISARALTSASVDWSMEAWTENNTYASPELTDIVQEIVNTSTWCGGTEGMTFIITEKTGQPMRNAQAFETSQSNAPTLKIAYDVNDVSGNGCTLSTYSGRITGTDDDVEETVVRSGAADDTMFIDSSTLEMTVSGSGGNKTQRIIGLRFQDIPVPKGTEIKEAVIQFVADASGGDTGTLTIHGEKAVNASRFMNNAGELSNRPKTSASATWELTEENPWTKNDTFETVDISNILNELISQGGWEAYNDIVLLISGDEGLRAAKAFDRSPAEAPVIKITVEGVLGDGSAGNIVRTHLKKTVRDMFVPWGAMTAIVDALYEAYLYYSGGEVLGGANRLNNLHYRISHPASHDGTADIPAGCDVNLDPYSAVCAKEKIAEAHAYYISPISSACQANHIVLLTDGQPTQNTVAGQINSDIGCANGYPDGTDYLDRNVDNSSNQDHVCGPELAQFMANEDMSDLAEFQNVMTHTVGFQLGQAWLTDKTGTQGNLEKDADGNPQIDEDVTAQNVQTVRYMKYIAGMGNGDFYPAESATDLLDAFKAIIAKAMTSSTSYATPSVSVSAFNRLFHRNEVYFSLFKPDNKQRWHGNVKKYLVCDGVISTGCKIGDVLDANGNSAVLDRYISPDARSFWSQSPDGEKVQEGGAGENGLDLSWDHTASNARTIFTDIAGGNLTVADNALTTENTGLTSAMFGVASDVERNQLIQWIRGRDLDDEDQDGVLNEMRWIYADPLHSSPAVMTYGGSETNPDSRLFVGTNDGLIRMLNASNGLEEWAFLPSDMFSIQPALRENANGERIYGVDASPTIWFNDLDQGGTVNGSDTVKLYFGMRRGGRNIYAFDVTTPESPVLEWTIKGGIDSGFEKLGQTWSAIRPIVINYGGSKKVVLMFGGGYDEEQDVAYGPSATGNAIYMVDPADGSLLWSASNSGADLNLSDMVYPIPSDLGFMDYDGDGAIDRVYVGDMGGQLWRIDISGIGQNGFTGTGGILGGFGEDYTGEQRRFFYPPEVVRITDTIYSSEEQYDLVLISSGNRTHPMGNTVSNQFYALRDFSLNDLPDINQDGQADATDSSGNETTFSTSGLSDLVDLTDNIIQAGSNAERTAVINDELRPSNGWYINLEAELGEKGLASPVVLDGKAFFTTYSPPDTTGETVCSISNDGNSRLYALDIFTAGSAFNFDGEGTDDPASLGTSDRSQMLREGITSDIVPMFLSNGDIRLLSNDLSLLGQQSVATIKIVPTFWMQE